MGIEEYLDKQNDELKRMNERLDLLLVSLDKYTKCKHDKGVEQDERTDVWIYRCTDCGEIAAIREQGLPPYEPE